MADPSGLFDRSAKVALVAGGRRGLGRALFTRGAGLGIHGGAA